MPNWHRPKLLKTRGQSAFLSKPKLGIKNSQGLTPISQIESLQGSQGDSIYYYYYINKGFAI